jgi:hypothetical protein
MAKKTVGWDARTGDHILFYYTEKQRRSAEVLDTWPHGIRVRLKNGRELMLSYWELQQRKAVYVR